MSGQFIPRLIAGDDPLRSTEIDFSFIFSFAFKTIGLSNPSNFSVLKYVPVGNDLILASTAFFDCLKINLVIMSKSTSSNLFSKLFNLSTPESLQLMSDKMSPRASLGTREFVHIIESNSSCI